MRCRCWAALLLFCCWQGIGWAGSIGFLAYQDNTWALYRWDLQNPPQKIYSNLFLRDWTVSPDQKMLVFSTTDGRMWKYDLDAKSQTAINAEGEDWQGPVFFSQNHVIAVKNHFTSDTDEAELVIWDISKNTIIEAIAQTGAEDNPCVCGATIVYSVAYKLPFGEFSSIIWQADLSKSIAQVLSPSDCKCIRPYCAPDGHAVAWLNQAPGGWQIISHPLDGRAPAQSGPIFDEVNSFIWDPEGSGFILLSKDQEGTLLITLNKKNEIVQRINPLGKGVPLREIRTWP